MIWIISGTQDGRELAAELADREQQKPLSERRGILMTVVSQYGKVLAEHVGLDIRVGRFTKEDMVTVIRKNQIDLILDASHPYAAVVSETAQSACRETDIRYVRYERKGIELPDYEKLHHARDEYEAAKLAGRYGERILLTTGSKTLPTFVRAEALRGKELWARVLPVSDVISLCEELGLKAKYILAMQGPFSYDMNLTMIRDYHIDVMVTKNSGFVGGGDTKLKAATDAHIHVVVIDKAKTDRRNIVVFEDIQDVLQYMEEYYGFYKKPQCH